MRTIKKMNFSTGKYELANLKKSKIGDLLLQRGGAHLEVVEIENGLPRCVRWRYDSESGEDLLEDMGIIDPEKIDEKFNWIRLYSGKDFTDKERHDRYLHERYLHRIKTSLEAVA